MLTVDILRQNKALSELSDEQLNAIATLSQNDETQVIQTKIKEERAKATLSLSQAFGIDDVTDLTFEKAVEFGKNKLSSVDSAKFEKTISDLKTELESEKAKKAGDKDNDKIAVLQAELNDTKAKYAELTGQLTEKEKEFNNKLADYKITSHITQALGSMKFGKGVNEAMLNIIKQQAVNDLKTEFTPTIVEKDGKESIVFMKDGVPYNNPANGLNPYSVSELLAEKLKPFGVLDEGRNMGGAGGKGGGKGTPSAIDLTGCKTKVEAQEVAHKYLAGKGLTVGSEEYQTELNTIWQENDIQNLPLQ